MSEPVIDASALLALLNREQGEEVVAELVARGSIVSAVNLSEVAAKLAEVGVGETVIHQAIGALGLEIVAFDTELAYAAGMLRSATRAAGLSLGDRACLALASSLGTEAVTCDRSWSTLPLSISVRTIR